MIDRRPAGRLFTLGYFMHWDFFPNEFGLAVSNDGFSVGFTCPTHSPKVDFYQPRPEFESSEVNRLQKLPAYVGISTGVASAHIRDLYRLIGEKTDILDGATGYISIHKRIEVQIWVSELLMERIVRTLEYQTATKGKLSLSMRVLPTIRGLSVACTDDDLRRFKSGELPAQVSDLPQLHVVKSIP